MLNIKSKVFTWNRKQKNVTKASKPKYPKIKFYQQNDLSLSWMLPPRKHPVYKNNKGISENSFANYTQTIKDYSILIAIKTTRKYPSSTETYYNPSQNIWHKLKKYSQIVQGVKHV